MEGGKYPFCSTSLYWKDSLHWQVIVSGLMSMASKIITWKFVWEEGEVTGSLWCLMNSYLQMFSVLSFLFSAVPTCFFSSFQYKLSINFHIPFNTHTNRPRISPCITLVILLPALLNILSSYISLSRTSQIKQSPENCPEVRSVCREQKPNRYTVMAWRRNFTPKEENKWKVGM